ncbi:MAG: glycoside hydrolase family 3 C-terminal domain-containing protein [Prevotella sp.]|nr:glycoside hydrolase family 3 C-terminal domain-containing protein [Prevotella sp.]
MITLSTFGSVSLSLMCLAFASWTTPAAAQQYVINDQCRQKARELVSKMTLEEKIDYLGGDVDGFTIRAIPRLGLPAVKMADGPQGMRNGVNSTLYPCGILSAASWNRGMVRTVGNSLGNDFRSYGVGIILGPGVNIYRAPMNGRNFEYFGEDPYLASETAVNYIEGVQDKGVIATVKHFALNNQEWSRHKVTSDADERTMEEIYFPTFRKAVEKAHVGAVMCSYNLVNGLHASENPWLLRDKLREEWGFKGILMSDWNSVYSGFNAIMAGLDLEMPNAAFANKATLLPLVRRGIIPESVIDEHVQHILQTLLAFHLLDKPLLASHPKDSDLPSSKQAALDMAREGIVLLKNDNVLPLKGTIAVIGPNADIVVKGGGSGEVSPFSSVSLWQGIHQATSRAKLIKDEVWKKNVPLTFKAQYYNNQNLQGQPVVEQQEEGVAHNWGNGSPAENVNADHFSARWTGTYTPDRDEELLVSAKGDDGFRVFINDKEVINDWSNHGVQQRQTMVHFNEGKPYRIVLEYYENDQSAEVGMELTRLDIDDLKHALSKADNVILSLGFNHDTEGEDFDRPFELDSQQLALIDAAHAANKNVVAVINSGGGVEMQSWMNKVKAIVMAWYPGQEGGTALADIMLGKISPSGKLPISIEAKWSDNPVHDSYYDTPHTPNRVLYSEGVFVGYRGYDKCGRKPLFPFGYGLSYTHFTYSNLSVSKEGNMVKVGFDVKNDGSRDGKEVAQVYVHDVNSPVPRPLKELKGYDKVMIKKGETKHITIMLDEEAFHYYDVNAHKFVTHSGEYQIMVGPSSSVLPLTANIQL